MALIVAMNAAEVLWFKPIARMEWIKYFAPIRTRGKSTRYALSQKTKAKNLMIDSFFPNKNKKKEEKPYSF